MNISYQQFLEKLEASCEARRQELQDQYFCYLQLFGHNRALFEKLDKLFYMEFKLLEDELAEIDDRKRHAGQLILNVEPVNDKPTADSIPRSRFVDEPSISYNLNSSSHYWDIVHGNPRGV